MFILFYLFFQTEFYFFLNQTIFFFWKLKKVTFITPTRRLLRDEELTQVAEGKKKPRQIFLFNDLFVVSKAGGGLTKSNDKLKVVGMIPLDMVIAYENDPGLIFIFNSFYRLIN